MRLEVEGTFIVIAVTKIRGGANVVAQCTADATNTIVFTIGGTNNAHHFLEGLTIGDQITSTLSRNA